MGPGTPGGAGHVRFERSHRRREYRINWERSWGGRAAAVVHPVVVVGGRVPADDGLMHVYDRCPGRSRASNRVGGSAPPAGPDAGTSARDCKILPPLTNLTPRAFDLSLSHTTVFWDKNHTHTSLRYITTHHTRWVGPQRRPVEYPANSTARVKASRDERRNARAVSVVGAQRRRPVLNSATDLQPAIQQHHAPPTSIDQGAIHMRSLYHSGYVL